MKRILILNFLAIFLIAFTSVNAQKKDEAKYRQASEEVRKQVWSWDMPQFKKRDIPEKYAKASKVIMAHHTELTADSKSKFQFYVITFGVKKEQTITEVVREMIKLNDKNAVTDYSELSFVQFQKTSGFYSFDKTTSYVGVRVIKPNGSMKEINADDIVLTTDDKSVKKAKVAIPDLEPGDIIDYFIATEQHVTNDFSSKPYHLFLFDDAPVLSYSFHAQLGKKYSIEYRSYNGAPELEVNKNDDKDIIVDVVKKDMAPYESNLWVAPALQLPFIRMNISLGVRGFGTKYLGINKPGEVYKITDSDKVLDGVAQDYSYDYYSGYKIPAARDQYDALEKAAKKLTKQSGLSYSDMSKAEKAAQLYYTLRFTKLLNFDIDQLSDKINFGAARFNGISFPLFCTFKAAGLDPAIFVSNRRTGTRMNEIMGDDDLTSVAYIPDGNEFFTIQSFFDIPFSIPQEIEGIKGGKSFTFDRGGGIVTMKKVYSLTNVDEGPKIKISSSEKNAHIENLKLSLTGDHSKLAVNRSTTLKGYYKLDAQSQLILYEDFYESERKAFNVEESLIEKLEDGRKSKKYAEEVTNAFAEARKKQKDAFVDEAKGWFGQDVTELKNYKTDKLGVRHTAPDFVYSSSFNLNGLIKKAGNNIIVEIGKIQGEPLLIKEDQRKRDLDIYAPFARSIEYNIEFTIPQGYSAEGVEALNKQVKNETGFFIAEAGTSGNIITIKIKKHYLHNYEPAANWNKMIEFTDAANDWLNAKILLKKI